MHATQDSLSSLRSNHRYVTEASFRTIYGNQKQAILQEDIIRELNYSI